MRPRRTNSQSQLRRVPGEKPGELILIVCEGSKTEPNYFKELRRSWRLSPTSIVVCGEECGSAPISVVNHAIAKKEEGGPEGLKYDHVWCVFDSDSHSSIGQAKNKAAAYDIKIALSVPCFELWYLLHFDGSTKPRKDCGEVIRALKAFLPKGSYAKGACPFDELEPRTDDAVKNAANLRKDRAFRPNPTTDVDLLVQALRELRRT